MSKRSSKSFPSKQEGKTILDYSATGDARPAQWYKPAAAVAPAVAVIAAPAAGAVPPPPIPHQLPYLSLIIREILDNKESLTTVDFSGTNLNGSNMDESGGLLYALKQAPHLNSIYLNNTPFWSGASGRAFAIFKNELPNVTSFDSGTYIPMAKNPFEGKTQLDYSPPDPHHPTQPRDSQVSIQRDMLFSADTIQSIKLNNGGIKSSFYLSIHTGSLSRIHGLEYLNMSQNPVIDNYTLSILTDLLPNWQELKYLNLSGNSKLFSPIPDRAGPAGSLAAVTSADILVLLHKFSDALSQNCQSLRELNISDTNLNADQLVFLLSKLNEIPDLSTIDLSQSKFGDVGAMTVCNFIRSSHIKTINLSNTALREVSIEPLLSLVESHPDLTIDLTDNFKAPVDPTHPDAPRALIPKAEPLVKIMAERMGGYWKHVAHVFANEIKFNMPEVLMNLIKEFGSPLGHDLTIYKALPAIAASSVKIEEEKAEEECKHDEDGAAQSNGSTPLLAEYIEENEYF